MRIVSEMLLVALVIFAHGWVPRIVAPPKVLSLIGIVINVLAVLAIAGVWLR